MRSPWYAECGAGSSSLANATQRPSEVRSALEATRMPVAEAPGDDETKQTYNFAPSYHGLVYRADGPEHGGQVDGKEEEAAGANAEGATGEPKYKLQSMQWGTSCKEQLTPSTNSPPRTCAVLDQETRALREQVEDDQLQVRGTGRRYGNVDNHEEDKAVHCDRAGLLRVAQEGQRQAASLHQA